MPWKPDLLSLICSHLNFLCLLYSPPLFEKEYARPEPELTLLVLISFIEIKPEMLFLTFVCKKETDKQELSPKRLFSVISFSSYCTVRFYGNYPMFSLSRKTWKGVLSFHS